jgi:hypothetical protein
MLYAGIVGFGIVMLFVIGASDIAWASVFIYLPFSVLILHILTRTESYGDAAAIARHRKDFPYNAPALAPEAAFDSARHSSSRHVRKA